LHFFKASGNIDWDGISNSGFELFHGFIEILKGGPMNAKKRALEGLFKIFQEIRGW
jgi:hypothetical protein